MISENLKYLGTFGVMENVNLTVASAPCPIRSVPFSAGPLSSTGVLVGTEVSEELRVTWGVKAADPRIHPPLPQIHCSTFSHPRCNSAACLE